MESSSSSSTTRRLKTAEEEELDALQNALDGHEAVWKGHLMTTEDIAKRIMQENTIRKYRTSIRSKIWKSQWQELTKGETNTLLEVVDDLAAINRLLSIQQEAATTTGVLAALGASVSITIIFSGTRGTMWPFFVAWWSFLLSLAITYIVIIYTKEAQRRIAQASPDEPPSETHPAMKILRKRGHLLILVITSLSLEVVGFGLWAVACVNLDGAGSKTTAPNMGGTAKIVGYIFVGAGAFAVCMAHFRILHKASYNKLRPKAVSTTNTPATNSNAAHIYSRIAP